jgi:hypothetical protein
MAKQNVPRPSDADLASFASFLTNRDAAEKAKRKQEGDAARAKREQIDAERAQVDALANARTAKDDAAAHVKRLRDRRATPDEIRDADAAYRTALAEFIAVESGKRPEWAPPPQEPAAEEPAAEAPGVEESATAEPEAETEAEAPVE